jgi:hypothetical protein
MRAGVIGDITLTAAAPSTKNKHKKCDPEFPNIF